jgi:serine/threonine protein kinase/Tol biopolymer transport system component
MTPERLRHIEDLFHAALSRPQGERAAFLSAACGDDESLRLEVESLITSREREGGLLERPAFEAGLRLMAGRPADLTGSQVGPYKILSLAGEGGMGEVYVALDTRLGRKVALKSLPVAFANDAERVRRFRQEARAASAITHPNVAQIYEVLESEGRHFIVMEFVNGITLRRRMAEGPLTLTACLDVACQVASALSAAHETGVVHRDIKPENVMLLAEGHVKVLDFGLAKRVEPAAGTEEAAPVSRLETSPGVIMGTTPYMSPEQARGLEVDRRTDIWSLGVVLYEMAAGRPPFGGATPTDVIAAIIQTMPPPLDGPAEEGFGELQAIIDRALAKEAGERYQTAREIDDDLRSLRDELVFESKTRSRAPSLAGRPAKGGAAPQIAPASRRLPVRRLVAAATFALLILAGGFLWRTFRANPPERFLPGRVEMQNLSASGRVLEAALSPDRRFVVFVTEEDGEQRLWMKQVATGDKIAVPLPHTAGAYRGLLVSPDGNYVYYSLFRDAPHGELFRTSIPAATDSRKLLEDVDPPVALSPDGTRLAFVRQNHTTPNELLVAGADGSNPHVLVADSDLAPGGVTWSPRGDAIACTVRVRADGHEFHSVAAFDLRDGRRTPLTAQRWKLVERVAWLPDGSGLVLIAADERSRLAQVWHLSHPGGTARRVTTDVNEYRTLSVTQDAAALATIQSVRASGVWVGWPAGGPSSQVASGRDLGAHGVAATPDGRIVYASNASGSRDLWIMNGDGSGQRQLTRDGRADRHPVVSPDGRFVVFISERGGSSQIWRVEIDGTNPRPLTPGPDDAFPAFTPDGRRLIYSARGPERRSLWQVPAEGGEPVPLTDYLSNWPAVSPDGRHLACLYREEAGTSKVKLAIVSLADGRPLRFFDLPSGIALPPDLSSPGFRWSRDGRSVLYVNTAGGASNIWSQPADGGPSKQLTDFTADRIFWFDLSPADGTPVYVRGQYIHDVVLIADQPGAR